MITIITYISLITGGLLIILMLLSLLAGLDLDFDIGGDTDLDVDGGGLGIVKSGLTFISVCCWVIRVILLMNINPVLATVAGIGSGLLAVALLSLLLRLLLKNQVNVNWSPEDALHKMAKVYLKIPKESAGIIQININGATRELKAKTSDDLDIATGDEVYVEDYKDGFAIVSKFKT